jgi:hypothetical protein
MSDLQELELKIRNLPAEELARFRAWFIEYDHGIWDRRIEADSKAGRLDALVSEAAAGYKTGKARPI